MKRSWPNRITGPFEPLKNSCGRAPVSGSTLEERVMLTVVVFIVGVLLGRLWFGFILLPIIYGIPRTVWNVIQRRVRASAILVYVFPVVLWSLLFFVAVLVLRFFVPSVAGALFASSASATGQLIGVFLGLLQMIAAQGRKDLDSDFWDSMGKFRREIGNVR